MARSAVSDDPSRVSRAPTRRVSLSGSSRKSTEAANTSYSRARRRPASQLHSTVTALVRI